MPKKFAKLTFLIVYYTNIPKFEGLLIITEVVSLLEN